MTLTQERSKLNTTLIIFILTTIFTVSFADKSAAINNGLLPIIAGGANVLVGIIKWASLTLLVVQIAILGIGIMTGAKDGADAISKITEKGKVLVIGFVIVTFTFLVQGFLKDFVTQASKSTGDVNVAIGNTDNLWDSKE